MKLWIILLGMWLAPALLAAPMLIWRAMRGRRAQRWSRKSWLSDRARRTP